MAYGLPLSSPSMRQAMARWPSGKARAARTCCDLGTRGLPHSHRSCQVLRFFGSPFFSFGANCSFRANGISISLPRCLDACEAMLSQKQNRLVTKHAGCKPRTGFCHAAATWMSSSRARLDCPKKNGDRKGRSVAGRRCDSWVPCLGCAYGATQL